jgi:N utilization substance protein B
MGWSPRSKSLIFAASNKFLSMISRRNIRVKVMQTLYTLELQKEVPKPGDPVRILEKHFEQTRQLFVYLV